MPEDLWREAVFKAIPKEKKWKTREKGEDTPNWMQNFREEQGEIRKPSSMINAKK